MRMRTQALTIAISMCLAVFGIAFGDAESENIVCYTSANIVGYTENRIAKGTTRIVSPFTEIGGGFHPLRVFSEVAVEGDEIYYYAGTNIFFKAVVSPIAGELHFISAKTGDVVDDYLLPAVLDGTKLKILYRRRKDVESLFHITGEVPKVILSDSPVQNGAGDDVNQDMGAFAAYIRDCLRARSESGKGRDAGLYTPLENGEKTLSAKHVDEWLDSLDKMLVGQFYVRYESGVKLVEFNAGTGRFVDVELGTQVEFDSKYVKAFEYVEREGTVKSVSESNRMPKEIVEDMNTLLNRKFFDDKSLLYVIYKKEPSKLAYIAGDSVLRDAQNGFPVPCDKGDIECLSAYPNPKHPDASKRAVYGKCRYLSDAEVVALQEQLLPRLSISEWFLTWIYPILTGLLVTIVGGYILYMKNKPLEVKPVRVKRSRKRR